VFERYSEPSVRALFVAKASAVATGARFIDTQHLLVGALEAWPDAGSRREEIVRRLGISLPTELPDAVSPEIPFSGVAGHVLKSAMVQADRLGHHRIRPEHLLLALDEEGHCATSGILRHAGLAAEELIRSAAQGALSDDSPLSYDARLELTSGRRWSSEHEGP
jgi:ATP-dependent Clp protease ATP-binding subunit ClpA